MLKCTLVAIAHDWANLEELERDTVCCQFVIKKVFKRRLVHNKTTGKYTDKDSPSNTGNGLMMGIKALQELGYTTKISYDYYGVCIVDIYQLSGLLHCSYSSQSSRYDAFWICALYVIGYNPIKEIIYDEEPGTSNKAS